MRLCSAAPSRPSGSGSQYENSRYANVASTASPGDTPGERERRGEPRLHEAEPSRRDRHLRQELRRTEGEQHQRGPRRRADGCQRSQQRRVVERPAPDGRGQCSLPLRAERGEDPVALAHEPPWQSREWRRAASQPVAHPLHDAPDPLQCAVAREQQRAERKQDDEHAHAGQRRLEQAARNHAPHDRRHGQHRHSEHDREREQVRGRQAGHRTSPLHAGLHEHPVLERRAHRATAGRDLGQRVAGELRGDHRPPPVDVQ